MISFTRIKNGASAELIAGRKNHIISIILLSFASVTYGFGTTASGSSSYMRSSGLAFFLYFASLVCLYSACIGSFKDMHDRPSADVQMSMPLSSAERYLSRLLTIGYIWLFPFLISAAVGILTAAAVDIINCDTVLNCNTGVLFADSLRMLIWFLSAALFIAAVTVICQCCTGSGAESRYTPFLLIIAVNLAPYLIHTIMRSFGSVTCGGKENMPVCLWGFSLLDIYDEGFVLFNVINCLISAAVIAGGLFIYRMRDARSVGMPVAFPLFLEITVFILLIMLFCTAHLNGGSLVVFFLAWLGSIILRIICARKSFSFKEIGIWTVMFGAYYIAFLIIIFLLFKTGDLGSMYRKTDLSELRNSSAEINVSLSIKETNDFDTYYYDYNNKQDKLMDFDHVYPAGTGIDAAQRFMDIGSRYAVRSASENGLFTRVMFGGNDGERFYRCRISIYAYDENYYSGNDYSVSFILTRDSALELRRELEGAEKAI